MLHEQVILETLGSVDFDDCKKLLRINGHSDASQKGYSLKYSQTISPRKHFLQGVVHWMF